ncbi:hypothetical protein [Clostridium botulinum]|uniref:hypothetical protein n=1 Tax=Clostridium botulinum TaxID=1491 RepID=UPI001C9B50E3|nr:hypothetical protein [Clostridium botulinum]MBY6838689.1 hypothetical protein [Clostridium botulinum]
MSVDIWDMAERATKIVKEQIKNDIYEDEVTGIFYQEFCEPTVAEKEILNGLEIAQKVIIQNTNNKFANEMVGYVEEINVFQKYNPILVSYENKLIKPSSLLAWVKRENLRSVD